MTPVRLVAVLFFLSAGAADAQLARTSPRATLTTGLSVDAIEVRVNYAAQRITLFASSSEIDDPDAAFAVALIGPALPHRLTRRDADGVTRFTFPSAPIVFATVAEPQIETAAGADARIAAEFDAAFAAMPEPKAFADPALGAWRAALVRRKEEQGLYAHSAASIERLEGGLLRASVAIPPDAPPGAYRVRAAVFRNGALVATAEQPLELKRGGLDATVYDLATRHGVVYGALAVLLGGVFGAAAALIGRR